VKALEEKLMTIEMHSARLDDVSIRLTALENNLKELLTALQVKLSPADAAPKSRLQSEMDRAFPNSGEQLTPEQAVGLFSDRLEKELFSSPPSSAKETAENLEFLRKSVNTVNPHISIAKDNSPPYTFFGG